MKSQLLKNGLAVSLSLMTLMPVVCLAQGAYWDNSGSSSSSGSSYYNPSTNTQTYTQTQTYSSPGQNYSQSTYGSNYGQYNNNTYGQQTYGQGNYGSYGQQPQQLQGFVSTAPAGTVLNVSTTNMISSQYARIGDPVSLTLGYDLSSNGNIVLPSGSQVQGEVVSAIPAGRTGRHGQLQLRFTRATLPGGQVIPLSARLVTQDGTGIIRGGTTANRWGGAAKNTVGGAAIGAAGGTALGAITSGGNKWNEGLLWGSILGAGAGLVKSGWDKGDEAVIQPGTPLQVMLDQPLSNSGGSGYSNNYQNNGYNNSNYNYNYNSGGYSSY